MMSTTNGRLFLAGLTAAWAAGASVALLPTPARACGGLFCSSANPVAVEQNAERILFTQNGDGTYSAYVEIQYAGEPRAFSWVVPVPDTPKLEVAPPSTLRLLDAMTRPSIIAPPRQCSAPMRSAGIGCGEMDMAGRAAEDAGGVNVVDLDRVGPYEPKVVSAEDPSLIFDWLNENGYLLTPEMRPYIERYATNGMKFLALRLAPDAGVSDIAPIKMTYPTPCPMVPLALTAVSAEPEMGVLVFFLADVRQRSTNYANLEIRPSDVRMDGLARDNYYALVSHRIDEAGGRAFVTELATPAASLPDPGGLFFQAPDSQEAIEHVRTLVAEHAYATRLYARLSAWEMTLDPEFEAAPDTDDVSNVFDLSQRPPIETCGENPGVACGGVYCGPGSSCGVNADGREGCVCRKGTVARAVTSPDLRNGSMPAVMCQDRAFTVMPLLNNATFGPCVNYSCGTGRCVVTNGFPTCECGEGELARLDPSRVNGSTAGSVTGMICEPAVEKWGTERLTWQEGDAGCTVSAGLGWAVFGLLALRRRKVRA